MKVWLDRLFYQEHHKGERLLFGAQKVSLATPSKTPFHMTCKEGQFDVANFLILEKWPKNVNTVHSIYYVLFLDMNWVAVCAISLVTRKRSLAWIYSLSGTRKEKIGHQSKEYWIDRETATQSLYVVAA